MYRNICELVNSLLIIIRMVNIEFLQKNGTCSFLNYKLIQ
jgi:hypothetical protein